MGQILISCFLDLVILLWYNRKNSSYLYFSLRTVICYVYMVTTVFLMNNLNIDKILVRVLLTLIVYIVVLWVLTDKREVRKIVVNSVILITCTMIAEFASSIILMIVVQNTNLEILMQNLVFWILSIVICRVTTMLLLYFITYFWRKEILTDKKMRWHIVGVFLIISYLYVILYFFSKEEIDNTILSIAFLVNILFVIIIFVIYFVYLNVLQIARQREEELKLLRIKNESQVNYYKSIDDFQQKIDRIYHDLKNHILIIDNLHNEKLKKLYLESLDEYFSDFSKSVNSGNDILDILIQKKVEMCKEKNINFCYNINFVQGNFVNLIDLGTIFGNIIDNAIEACEKVDNADKKIVLLVDEIGEFILIKISNPYKHILKRGNNFLSLKKGCEPHGLGLLCLEDALEKYNGSYTYITEDKRFVLTILLPISH